MAGASLADRLTDEIAATGPLPVSRYIEAALYDPIDGFYVAGGQAGRRGDFLTAPEVGPLFGAVVARAVDSWWDEAGRPSRFVVEEWGAGPGTLARGIVAAEPAALVSGALQWVQVERSPNQRALHFDHPQLSTKGQDEIEGVGLVDVVFANELLDNLPFDIVERTLHGWMEIRVGPRDDAGRFTLVPGHPLKLPIGELPVGLEDGRRVPLQRHSRAWIEAATARSSRVVVIDYGADSFELGRRDGGWLRTHQAHGREADWLVDPGSCDITTDVALDQIPGLPDVTTQAEWLEGHGIGELVAEGRAIWEAGASVGDLAAVKGRSRIGEAEALLDLAGMGAFHVWQWVD